MRTPQDVKIALDNAINFVVENKNDYVVTPGKDFSRNRKLDMSEIIKITLGMTGNSLTKELYDYSKIINQDFSKSAFVQQKAKITNKAFDDIFHMFNESCRDKKTYRGYRLYAVDGTDLCISRNPEHKDSYTTLSTYLRGYNLLHINAMYDIANKTYADCIIEGKNKSDERKALWDMLKRNQFKSKSIILADRGYESYNTVAHLLNTKNVDFLVRTRSKQSIRPISKLPLCELDIDVSTEITTTQSKEDKARGRIFIQTGSKKGKTNSEKTVISKWDFPSPYTLNYRVVRFQLNTGEYETIVTSLTRDKFSIEEIKNLYHMRWGIETGFRELKYAIGLLHLHSKKIETIYQEIYAALIMYNYCERIASMAIVIQKEESVYAYQLNFTMAFAICKKYYRYNYSLDDILSDIEKYVSPIRPGRRFNRKPIVKGFINFTYRIAA